jgi:multidrug efflux pump subunit AcrB
VFGGQGSLFGGFDSENGISLLLQGAIWPNSTRRRGRAMAIVKQDLPGAQVRPQPDLDFTAPELRLVPQDRRLAEVGWDRTPMPAIIQTFGDGSAGRRVFRRGGAARHHADGADLRQPDELKAVPLATPSGRIVPLGELLRVEHDMGPASIFRADGRRSISLQISPRRG